MFCPKCGTKALDGATFCQKCGAKLITDSAAQQSATSMLVQQTPPSTHNVPSDTPKKKKSKKLPIILVAVVLAVVAIIVIAMNWNGKIDYEATVRAHQPFAVSEGLSYTYGEVLDKYISSPDWKVRDSGDVSYVDISGKAKGTDNELLVTIKVTPDEKDSDIALITPESVTVANEKSPTQNDAVEFLLGMFLMYDKGDDDLSYLLSDDTADKILYQGVPVDQLLGVSPDDFISIFGEPDTTNYGGEELIYGSVTINIDMWSAATPYLSGIHSSSLDDFTYNGQPLSDNYDELTQIMGKEPDEARVFGDAYSMSYQWEHMGSPAWLTIETPAAEGSTAITQVGVSWWVDTTEEYQEPSEAAVDPNATQNRGMVSYTDLLGTWQWQGKNAVDAALGVGGTKQLTLYSNGTCKGEIATSGNVNGEFILTFVPDAWSFLEYEQVLQASAMTTGWDWDSNGSPIEVPVYKTMNFKVTMSGNAMYLENVENPGSKYIEYIKVD